MQTVSIFGVGRLGGALSVALSRKGCEIQNLISRNQTNAQKIAEIINPKPKILTDEDLAQINSDIIFITTQDAEIETSARKLAENLKIKPIVFHTSGSLSSEILKELKETGCATGSIHPLVSISEAILGAERFSNAFFCIEGDSEAVSVAEKIVADLGGKSFSIKPKYKSLYHAAAVTACGHIVVVIDIAYEMLGKCGLSDAETRTVLMPLIESTIANLKTQTTSEALTGTFARADAETFKKHLEIMREHLPDEVTEVYLQLGERSLHLAEEQGVSREKVERLRKEISLAKKNLKC